MKWLLPAAYLGTIVAANWLLVTFHLIPVGFGLMAPAGVLAAGLAFTLRDLTQDALGLRVVLGAIVGGALLSAFLSPQFAIASAAAFLTSELADWAVYTPIRRHHWLGAVAASNMVGLVLDSILFLWLAFGSLEFLVGQVAGKVEMTVLAVVMLAVLRKCRAVPEPRYAPAR